MNVGQIHNDPPGAGQVYTFAMGKGTEEVHEAHIMEAVEIDTDKDQNLTDKEIKEYLKKQDILRDPAIAKVNEEKILEDYKLTLLNRPLPQTAAYHSYQQMVAEMAEYAEKYPNLCEMVTIGTTAEGRDIPALIVSKKPEPPPPPPQEGQPQGKEGQAPPSQEQPVEPRPKPSVLITGVHHAREHISLEPPIFAFKAMLDNCEADPQMKRRVEGAKTIFVPMVNPDGYEFSRTENPWWRKNRHVITADDIPKEFNIANVPGNMAGSSKAGPAVKGIGVDNNRNYWDGTPENLPYFRPEGDTPNSTYDDKGASDRPSSDTYRGPKGGEENEVKPLINMMKTDRSIKAAIDFHAYGQMILYPLGVSYEHAKNEEQYKEVAQNMAKIIADSDDEKVRYRPMQSSKLYPASGSSEDFQYSQGILGITVELADSFSPDPKEIQPTARRLLGAQMYLIDYVMDNPDKLRPD
jgi:hypothetical protein